MSLQDDIRSHPLIHLLPQYYQNKEDFLVFAKLFFNQYDISEKYIREFTNLTNPDKVPMKFIQALGSYTNYTYQPLATDEFNRELLMRMLHIWEQRGTKQEIINAASYGENPGWVGADVWIPGYYKPGQVATITLPRDSIFRHNISKFSGTHVLEDGNNYMPGIIKISVPYISKAIRDRIYQVTPAGRRLLFEVVSEFYPNAYIDPLDIGSRNELSFYKHMRIKPIKDEEYTPPYDRDTDIDFTYVINMVVQEDLLDILIHSRNDTGRKLHSGREAITTEYTLKSDLGVSMLSVDYLSQPFEVNGSVRDKDYYIISPTGEYLNTKKKDTLDFINHDINDTLTGDRTHIDINIQKYGAFKHNDTKYGVHDSLYTRSGLDTHTITLYAGREPINPYDVMYTVDDVADKYWWEYRDNYNQTVVEVIDGSNTETLTVLEDYTHTYLEEYGNGTLEEYPYGYPENSKTHGQLKEYTHGDLTKFKHKEV